MSLRLSLFILPQNKVKNKKSSLHKRKEVVRSLKGNHKALELSGKGLTHKPSALESRNGGQNTLSSRFLLCLGLSRFYENYTFVLIVGKLKKHADSIRFVLCGCSWVLLEHFHLSSKWLPFSIVLTFAVKPIFQFFLCPNESNIGGFHAHFSIRT